MTTAQWLFEYLALREKEKEEFELISLCFKSFKKMMINLLGLNLFPKETKEGEQETETDEEEDDPFVPFALMAGRREVIETILKRFESEAEKPFQEDDDFERISAAMAKGEDLGDMAPMFEVDEKTDQKLGSWFTPGKMDELQRLGVKVTPSPHKATVHIDTDVKEIKRRQVEQRQQNKKLNEELIQQLEQEQKDLKKRGVIVTFDDHE